MIGGAAFSRIPVEPADPLHTAVKESNVALISLQLSMEGDVNVLDARGRTPLHIAAERGNKQIILILLAAGANPTIRNSAGLGPFQIKLRGASHELQILLGDDKTGLDRKAAKVIPNLQCTLEPTIRPSAVSSSQSLFGLKHHATPFDGMSKKLGQVWQKLKRSNSEEHDTFPARVHTKPSTQPSHPLRQDNPPKLSAARRSTSHESVSRMRPEELAAKFLRAHLEGTCYSLPRDLNITEPLVEGLIRGRRIAEHLSSCSHARVVSNLDDCLLIRIQCHTPPADSPQIDTHPIDRSTLPSRFVLKPLTQGPRGLAEVAVLSKLFPFNAALPHTPHQPNCLRSWMPHYHGLVQIGPFVWVVLADQLHPSSWSTLHLRIFDAPPPSHSPMPDTYPHYSDLGFRIASMAVQRADQVLEPIYLDRKYGMCLTPRDVHIGFVRFLTPANGGLQLAAAKAIVTELQDIAAAQEQAVVTQCDPVLVSGSVVVSYDLNAASPSTESKTLTVQLFDAAEAEDGAVVVERAHFATALRKVADVVLSKIINDPHNT